MFEIIDMRGKRGFPDDDMGLVYKLRVFFTLPDKYTGIKKKWNPTFLVRSSPRNDGWRIDKVGMGVAETVRGMERVYPTPESAAKVLSKYLDKVKQGKMRQAARRKTFREAREVIFDYLRSKGWDIKDWLRVPHATSPDGNTRLWFKTQAVYHAYDPTRPRHQKFNQAHSMWVDIRKLDGPAFLRVVKSWDKTKEGDF